MPSPALILLFLMTACFALATELQLRFANIRRVGQSEDSLLKTVLGDGRRMFANHFFNKADVYFHSGYYPTFIEQAYATEPIEKSHLTETHDDHDHEEHEQSFLGQPADWIDRFGRHFYSTTHSHLDKPGEAREILPWLRISADLDPHHIETYTVAAYWLREHMGKINEAEGFLREGLRANPSSYEILFDLGKLYDENRHDPARARNLWELALGRWYEQDDAGQEPDLGLFDDIVAHLAHLEEEQGNLAEALSYKEVEVEVSPFPEVIQKQVDELKKKLAETPRK
jgi:tetratricopeptide (TPR) repeat protein